MHGGTEDRRRPGAIGRVLAAFARVGLVMAVVGPLLVVAGGGTAQAAPSLAGGFVVRDMPSGQSELLTDFDFAPDGSYFTTGKNGSVAWVSADGQPRTLATFPVVTVQDLGLTGVAVAHDYATSRVLYLARTLLVGGQRTARLSVVPAQGNPPTSLGAERVIWELPVGADAHSITGIEAPADGTLWVTMGDGADFRFMDPLALRALDLNTGYGKLLHLLPDGRGVPSNPFYDAAAPSSWKSRVYASGFRSPFRVSLDPATGAPIVGDVGWNSWEEIDLVQPGASYGWPCWEGDTRTPEYRDLAACRDVGNTAPLWTYPHGPQGTSVTGGIVYAGSVYPEAYRGAYFFGDYASRRVYTLRYDGQGRLTRQPEADGFGSENGLPVKFGATVNGDIVYADIAESVLKRLVYLPGNRPPTAQAATTVEPATRTVTFDGTASADLDGDPLSFTWDFGDGSSTGSGPTVTHVYASPIPTTARLTVTDAQGATGTTSITVTPANHVPVITLTAPSADTRFAVGDVVEATASAVDPDETAPLVVTWSEKQIHCSGGYCHDHPGRSFTGPEYAVPFVHHSDDTHFEITASVTDSHGATSRQSFVAQPRLRTLSVLSNSPSPIAVNGVARQHTQVTVGARISVTAPVMATDEVSTFAGWDDGAAPRERTGIMPDRDLALTATYATPIDLRYTNEPGLRALLGAPLGQEAGDRGLRYRVYERGRMYWTPAAGAHEVHGSILDRYLTAGGHLTFGVPLTDETTTPDGAGRFNHFAWNGASIYWHPHTGAHAVYGAIAARWRATGFELGVHGYPRSSEAPTPNGRGRFNDFQYGGIYWRPGVPALSVYGAIYAKWGQYSWEGGFLGFPLTDELGTPDRVGRFNHFEGGSVYWTPRTGAHEVHGAILDRWRRLGWERSYLGYPTSDEFTVAGGRRSNFQYGYITWNARTGQVIDRRY